MDNRYEIAREFANAILSYDIVKLIKRMGKKKCNNSNSTVVRR